MLVILLGLAGCAETHQTPAPEKLSTTVKVILANDGIYEIPASTLRAAGVDLDTLTAQELDLTTGGTPVAFAVVDDGKERALRFYGQRLPVDAYAEENVYWLSRQSATDAPTLPGMMMRERPASPPTSVEATTVVSATIHLEEQQQYVADAKRAGERWLWASLFAPASMDVAFSTPYLVAGEAVLQLSVWGDSSAPVDPDHHLRLYVNGHQVADDAWDGAGEHLITASVPAGVLRSGENTLTLQSPGDTTAIVDSVLLDWAEITYSRELVNDTGTLEFCGQAPAFSVRIRGSAGKAKQDAGRVAIWDVTDRSQPVTLTHYRTQGDSVSFASDGLPRCFAVATRAGLRQPLKVIAATSPDLRNWPDGADMIIVTAPQFHDALAPLVAARQAAGLRVALADVSAVYDTFSYGRAAPEAIRALVRHSQQHWAPPAPRFLLLAGDASYDPRGYLGGSELDIVPTQLVPTTFTGWTASDIWYALPDENPSAGETAGSDRDQHTATLEPVLAVGRLPAQTAEQMRAMVGKVLAYEQGNRSDPWHRTALLVADNDETGFETEAQAFADALVGFSSQVVTLAGDGSAARASLLQAFENGIGLLGYFGHGSLSLWAQEKIFSVDDVPQLTNDDRLPIVFTVTCLSGFFEHPVTPSLGEALLRAANGGTVAALVPSSAALLDDQRLLAQALARALGAMTGSENSSNADRHTLGEVIRQAQSTLPISSDSVREVLLTFNLLGDPAMMLQR